MNRTTTRGLATGAVVMGLFLAGSAALAGQGLRGGREGAPGRGIRAALGALDLTTDQKAKMKELLESEREKHRALRQEAGAAREALRTAADAAAPDPATVGAAFLRVDALRKAMRAERDSSRKRLEALLTAEQRAKLEGWRGAHRYLRGAAFGLREGGSEGPGRRPPLD